ncbi:CAF17-like 4Fe-4S cluster assembly/insertion protein YgfZ [Castellaniella sp. S9]|uniref:CAF17-like 4Fe-4S cluster assembly/insertion protein YgfZ n=1 Tax=Castellaniella sp. S9 TaxID=2993652 RepID=UPI0022B4D373|nr:folate-binding protein [Castellaniella sp. S9]
MPEFSCPARTRLDDLAVLTIAGPDAEAFLHGQITNAVQDMPDEQARPAAYCSAQGRMLANLVVWRSGPEDLRVMLARDLAPAVARRLGMFVLRAKVRIQVEDGLSVLGCSGSEDCPAAAAVPWTRGRDAEGDWIAAPAHGSRIRAWRVVDRDLDGVPADDAAWRAADLAAGRPWIRAATQDLFLPTALDMDLNGGIDFGKGCYPGQEVIARTHYRGTVKRRMAYGTAAWPDALPLPLPGADLYEAGGARPAGRVIDLVRVGDTVHAAVEITLTDWPAMRYALAAADGPVLSLSPPRALAATA